LAFSFATPTSLTATWNSTTPPGNSYTFQASTDTNFNGIITSSNTVLNIATASVPALSINTTYYGRVNSIVNGSSSDWTSYITTATLAVIPTTAVSTWTVYTTSLTVNWLNANGNPSNVTKYVVELSTDSGFAPVATMSSSTYLLTGNLINLVPDATYYAQVKAVNHSEISTNYLTLGSTITNFSGIPTIFIT